jgi:hypothetical protein
MITVRPLEWSEDTTRKTGCIEQPVPDGLVPESITEHLFGGDQTWLRMRIMQYICTRVTRWCAASSRSQAVGESRGFVLESWRRTFLCPFFSDFNSHAPGDVSCLPTSSTSLRCRCQPGSHQSTEQPEHRCREIQTPPATSCLASS